ncbi:MAG: polysaccharide biosynthesis/export family protein [Acidobacteria bacterium]|nr:polysaccharide biosynthesis/export family protein [Acidobacteriota bacterium]
MPRLRFAQWLLAVLAAATMPLPAQDGASGRAAPALPAYRIGPGDVLQIDVWKEPDVSVPSVTVRPDGRISLAIIGEVRAAGLSPSELETAIADRLGAVIKAPRVTVTVRDASSQKVYLIGELRREGTIRMTGPMTVLQALAEAGGITDYAKRRQIYILRIAGDRRVRLPFDYEAVVRGQKAEQNVVLQPGDTIVVPR